jgi:hypothetical protein
MKRSSLTPSLALRHPLFWGALAILLLNDHVLKGAGVLPGALTGKLSDFAGLLVAPVVLASLLRVRSVGGWGAAHALTGLVFAGIQLSEGAAMVWGTLMSATGFPWAITRDATDLVALPMLAVSLLVFGGVARRRPVPARRTLEMVGAGVGMTACLATSPPPEFEEFYPSFSATGFVHNGSDTEVSVLVRPLRADAEIDCFEAATQPGFFLREALFDTGELWAMPGHTNIPLPDDAARECNAVHVSGDVIEPFVVFQNGERPEVFVDGESFETEWLSDGGVILIFDDGGAFIGHRSTGTTIDYAIVDQAPEGEACEPLSDGERVDWSPLSLGDYDVIAIETGVDGCHRFSLRGSGESEREWYLCVPEAMQPFAAGDRIRVEGADGGHALAASRVDAAGSVRLEVARSVTSTSGVTAGARPIAACTLQVDDACGVVSRPAEVAVRIGEGEPQALAAGMTLTGTIDDLTQIDFHVAYAADRLTMVAGCAEGTDLIGTDVETVVVVRSL